MVERMWGLYQTMLQGGGIYFTGTIARTRQEVIARTLKEWQGWSPDTDVLTWPRLKRRYGLFVQRVVVTPERSATEDSDRAVTP